MNRKLIVGSLLLLALLVCLGIVGIADSWFMPAFQGGELSKGSFFSYPRYHAKLPPVDLGHNGNYSVTFSGFPVRDDVSIELDLPGKTYKDSHEVSSRNSTLSLVLEDVSGKNICRASGQLKHINNAAHHWVLAASNDFAGLWNSDCINLTLNPREVYTLTVTVDGAEGDTSLPARPILKGGGIELP